MMTMRMKPLISRLLFISSIIAIIFIVAFFVIQIIVIKNKEIMSRKLQVMFGISFLIISICLLAFLIIVLVKKINIPSFIEVNLLEFFIAAIVIGATSLFLIFKK